MASVHFIDALIIAALAGVQSIFGMGLLVFGTPTFLILGVEFTETLGLLLPSSLAISIAQVILFKGQRPAISKALYALCLPVVGATLFLTISLDLVKHVYLLVATALAISALSRSMPRFQAGLRACIVKYLKVYHVVMGLVHGMTNIGGALLGVMAATIHNDKTNARYVVAVYYLAFVLMQATVLLIALGPETFAEGLLYVPLSLIVFASFGNRLFQKMNNHLFQHGMTVFLALYAVILVVKWIDVI